jgi:hypothetical protein
MVVRMSCAAGMPARSGWARRLAHDGGDRAAQAMRRMPVEQAAFAARMAERAKPGPNCEPSDWETISLRRGAQRRRSRPAPAAVSAARPLCLSSCPGVYVWRSQSIHSHRAPAASDSRRPSHSIRTNSDAHGRHTARCRIQRGEPAGDGGHRQDRARALLHWQHGDVPWQARQDGAPHRPSHQQLEYAQPVIRRGVAVSGQMGATRPLH